MSKCGGDHRSTGLQNRSTTGFWVSFGAGKPANGKKVQRSNFTSMTSNHGPSLIPGCESNCKRSRSHQKMKVTTLTPKLREPSTSYQANMQNSQNTPKRQFEKWCQKNNSCERMDEWSHKQQGICSKREWKSTANTCQPQTSESAGTRSSEMPARMIIGNGLTELEKIRSALDEFSESDDENATITREEFNSE